MLQSFSPQEVPHELESMNVVMSKFRFSTAFCFKESDFQLLFVLKIQIFGGMVYQSW